MTITQDDLTAFHQFATAKLAASPVESLSELVDIWEMEHPSPELYAQNVAAIRAALRDMENGDTGEPAEQVIEEIRAEIDRRYKI